MVNDNRFLGFRNPRPIRNFGNIGPNGLTFTKSVNDPNSCLMKVLRFIRDFKAENNGIDPRKIDILRGVWNWDIRVYRHRPAERGWNANFFRFAVKNGFLRHYRSGNTVRWTFGDSAQVLNRKSWAWFFHDIPTTATDGDIVITVRPIVAYPTEHVVLK